MKLTVLGGAHAAVNIGQGSNGYLVTQGATSILIDPGFNNIAELRKHTDPRLLSGVVLSHEHVDHFLDIITLRNLVRINALPNAAPIPLLLPPGFESMLREVVAPIARSEHQDDFLSAFAVREYDPDQAETLGDITISFTPGVHSVPVWAMRFVGNGATGDLVFSADTGPTADLAAFASGAKVFLCEASYGIDPKRELQRDIRHHLTLGEAIRIAQEAKAGTLVITHTSDERDNHTYADFARKQFTGPVHLAQPGLTIEWD